MNMEAYGFGVQTDSFNIANFNTQKINFSCDVISNNVAFLQE